MEFVKLEFEYSDDVTVINRKQFETHMKLYEGYINKMNEIDMLLKNDPDLENANSTYSKYRGIKRGETFALNGVMLHEYYFENIGGKEKEPNEMLMNIFIKNFGSFENWKKYFVAAAKASRGWVVFCYEARSDHFRNISLDAHDMGNLAYSIPLLVIDMYEHAYFLQYADNKAEYINNFMNNIDWSVVADRLESC